MKNTPCPLSKKCGGCQLQNMDYDRQLKYKQALVGKILGGFGKVERIRGMDDPTHYRCKVQAAFGTTRSGKIVSGVYQSSSHRIVNVDSCLIENEKADAIIVTIRSLLPSFKIRPYDEDKRTGLLRHVLVRVGQNSGEIMVVLVTAGSQFPSKNDFVKALLDAHPEITTIVQNVNTRRDSMVLGDVDKPMFGKGFITDTLCGCTFKISPQSFYQINPTQTEHLYNAAVELAHLTGGERVIDAYCGTGTIGLIAARHAGEVLGIESNESAVRDARLNAKMNDAQNIRFICADAGEVMADMAAENERCDVVLMDPPRAGSSKQFLTSLVRLNPERVVYISCNPETLARDLRFLTKSGYKVKKIKPFDLFPFTRHVETVVSLVRKTPDMYVDFKIDLDEQDLTASESHPTYEEIKAYIQKEYGVKVSSLYISQVKRKLGLEVGESYNKPKSENAKQPQCPADKEKMIVAALKYFMML